MFIREIQEPRSTRYLQELHPKWVTAVKNIFLPRVCWLPSFERNHAFSSAHRKETDIISDTLLSHGGLENITEIPYWPDDPVYRLWTLTQDNKTVLNKLLCLPKDCVGLRAKSCLGELSLQESPSVNWSRPTVLIYKGDIAPKHNIEGLILFCHAFQSRDLDVRLVLQGPLKSYAHEDLSLTPSRDFKAELKNLINSLSWKTPPSLIEDINAEVSLKLNEQKIAANFSTAWDDDFPIYLFEAQREAAPILCSYWGGHKELSSSSVMFIPEAYIPCSYNLFKFQKGVAESLVEKLLSDGLENVALLEETATTPRPIGHEELMEYYEQARQKWFSSLHAGRGDDCPTFSTSLINRYFFQELRKIKRGNLIEKNHCIFYPQAIEDQLSSSELIYKWGRNVVANNEQVHFIALDTIHHGEIFKRLSECHRVTLVGCDHLKNFVINVIGDRSLVETIDL
jgi:hypothetical protein